MNSVEKMLCVLVSSFVCAGTAFSQAANPAGNTGSSEKSVEEAYSDDSQEAEIIQTQSQSIDRNDKMLALDYIDDMLNQGKGAKVANVIVNLASEGIINRDTAGGRVINDFPDVRARAVEDLGQINTPQAKAALVNICQAEREPGVLYAAVNSLVKQTTGSPEQNITAIYNVYYRFNAGDMPDNRLALAVLNAFDVYIKNNQVHDKRLVNTLMAIKNDARYIYPVRERAEQLLQSFLVNAKSAQSAQSAQSAG